MRKNKGKLTGILGTLIIHLIAGIIFISLQLRSLQKVITAEYQVELAPAPAPETVTKKDKIIEVHATSVEKVLKGDAEMLNIARNLSSKPAEKINPSDYIDKVKEELIKSGKLGVNNYIDEQKIKKRLREHFMRHNLELENEIRKTRLTGIGWFILGAILMLISTYLVGMDEKNFFIKFLLILLEPAGWFLFWEGLNYLFMEYKEKLPDYKFYKKMSKLEIFFLDY